MTAAVLGQSLGDLAWLSEADAAPGPAATDEPHPTLMRTPSARPAGQAAVPRASPCRSPYSFVPSPVAKAPHLTEAAILVKSDMKVKQAAPASEL
jgi:hypothetical protein